ncbi:Dyp-type peroxidase [Thiohalocapsa halophila]|uniref:Dyp-type peroxidase n=1 Tax=Thiohalocapsa halophila TaxID=69359 RepID=UPI0019070DC4|nr:Dyp-type peroxidase [Thiohalocapsa halophila]
MSTTHLNLADIQGNVVRAYGRFGFPCARYYFLRVDPQQSADGRALVDRVRRRITTAVRWREGPNETAPGAVEPPDSTLNIAFTFYGLLALGLPTSVLARMPPEFIEGMPGRTYILGDEGDNAPEHWDPIWRTNAEKRIGSGQTAADGELGHVHIWLSINARSMEQMEAAHETLMADIAAHPGLRLLPGHGADGADYQAASAIFAPGPDDTLVPTGKEHFGFTDGIGDPVFDGRYEPDVQARRVKGRGRLTPATEQQPDQQWVPLATGEFLLGHADESQELPPTAPPWEFTRNGTFMVFRKLHQNVKTFHDYTAEQAALFGRLWGLEAEAALATLKAKLVGRWSDGIPLIAAPTYDDWRRLQSQWRDVPAIGLKPRTERTPAEQARKDAFDDLLANFTFGDDKDGIKCPYGAHLRRVNTRDMLDPELHGDNPEARTGSSLNKRRRILRRGLPYGHADPDNPSDDGEHGVIFIALCASLSRQFEFLQQQWIQYGLDFNTGNDTCPLVGNHRLDDRRPATKHVIAADPAGDAPPFIAANLPNFVTTRGGDYFFLPGINALRMIAQGSVDPT